MRSARALRRLGLRLALDNFGTGSASLTTLLAAPFDIVKIDRRFVHDVGGRTGPVIHSIIRMAADVGMSTVAEGVETAAQCDLPAEMGCGLFQGYHFARPGPLSSVVESFGTADRQILTPPALLVFVSQRLGSVDARQVAE